MLADLAKKTLVAVTLVSFVSIACADAPDAARVEQIAQWIGHGTYSPTPKIEDREFWQRVGRSDVQQGILKTAEAEAHRSFGPFPDELYLEYSRNGNRSRYQSVYFRKLKTLRTLVIAECVENKGRFIEPIQKIISSYASDRTWVLPAHDSRQENFEGRRITIDLFASEVACDLACTDHLLGKRLAESTRATIRREAERRIFEPYRNSLLKGEPRLWWITGTNNWNAVCLANVTGTALALLEKPEDKAFYVAAAEKAIQSFLKGFTPDGYCSEGVGYWNYGFGCFVRLGHMLDEVTEGNVDLFELPKARSAALFARRMSVTPGLYPAFADCSVGSRPSSKIMQYVSRHYDLLPTAQELERGSSLRWLDELGVFSLVFDDPRQIEKTAEPAVRDWFNDAGIMICRGAKTGTGLPLAVAFKGGHNAEHHNHNDVGSYVVCVGSAMPLTDPGAEVYTRRTFSKDRYVSGVLNSFGHPVPRIAGKLQKTGRAATAKVLEVDLSNDRDSLALDLTSAYDVPALKQLKRTFEFRRDVATFTVTDEVTFDAPESFGTAIITFDSWQRTGTNSLRIGAGKSAVAVEIDTGTTSWSIQPEKIDEDVRGGKKPMRLGIELGQPVREATVRLTIKGNPE